MDNTKKSEKKGKNAVTTSQWLYNLRIYSNIFYLFFGKVINQIMFKEIPLGNFTNFFLLFIYLK